MGNTVVASGAGGVCRYSEGGGNVGIAALALLFRIVLRLFSPMLWLILATPGLLLRIVLIVSVLLGLAWIGGLSILGGG